MKLRNTTDFDTATLRSLIRVVVREVQASLAKHHPLGERDPQWRSSERVAQRAEFILKNCDVWVRQRRPEAVRAKRKAALLERAAMMEEQCALYPDANFGTGTPEHLRGYAENVPLGPTHHTGRAWRGGGKMVLTLGNADVVDFLWLTRHEVWHLFGIKHEHFPEAVMHQTGGADAAIQDVYAAALAKVGPTLPPQAAPEPSSAPSAEDRATGKLVALAEKEKRWTTKLRRAQTALSKLKKQRSYYERQVAVAASRGKP